MSWGPTESSIWAETGCLQLPAFFHFFTWFLGHCSHVLFKESSRKQKKGEVTKWHSLYETLS